MAMTKAKKEKMEALAIGAESVAKANDILVKAIKRTMKENRYLFEEEDCTSRHLIKALEKVKGGVVVKAEKAVN